MAGTLHGNVGTDVRESAAISSAVGKIVATPQSCLPDSAEDARKSTRFTVEAELPGRDDLAVKEAPMLCRGRWHDCLNAKRRLNLHVAPADWGRARMNRQGCGASPVRGAFSKVQFVPRPRSIRALAGPGTRGLAFPSNQSCGHGFPARAASKRTWPARSSRILVQHTG